MDPLPVSLLVSALGGAVAALFLRSIFRLIGKVWSERKPLAEYGCADSTKKRPALLVHGRGKRIDDPLSTNKRAWEHTPQAAEEDRVHTIYGPHVNDFGKPGYYRVSFRIYGSGFSNDATPVIILDVIQRPIFLRDNMIVVGQRIVRSKELVPKYKGFDVYCYAAGSGTYEYRCQVIPESFDPKEHVLRFDVIQVYNHIPTWEVF